MRSWMKLAVLLFCVQKGEGHWLHSLLEQRGQSPSSPSDPPEEERRGGEASEDNNNNNNNNNNREGSGGEEEQWSGEIPIRSRRSTLPESACGLRSLLLQVRDLGLGYDSDETVLFKYCSGTCPRVRSNHDLTLTNLLMRGALSGEVWHNTPCCRPTHHEDLAFLDNAHHWHKVEKLSAAACSCVG